MRLSGAFTLIHQFRKSHRRPHIVHAKRVVSDAPLPGESYFLEFNIGDCFNAISVGAGRGILRLSEPFHEVMVSCTKFKIPNPDAELFWVTSEL